MDIVFQVIAIALGTILVALTIGLIIARITLKD